MKYKAHFYCDNCGSRWITYYKKLSFQERGDCCDKCSQHVPFWTELEDTVVEPHFYEKVED